MVEEGGNGVVHEGVRLDEVQVGVVQLLAVVRARTCKHLKYEPYSNGLAHSSLKQELLVYACT